MRRTREVDGDADAGRDSKAAKTDDESNVSSAVVREESSLKKKANAFATSTGIEKKGLSYLLAEKSEGSSKHVFGGNATAYNEVDTAEDRDARAIAERNLALQEEEGVNEDGSKIYRGQAGYKNHLKKDAASVGNNKNTGTQGPIRAPAFFRATCRFDFQPDICKDYRDTGFCGFGDSCKFMHDRGNYKSGWQMEKEWDEKQAKRKSMIAMGMDPDAKADDDAAAANGEFLVDGKGPGGAEELPYACHLCRGPFVEPVKTKCGHYFCQDCMGARYKEGNPKCPICDKNTAGIFNHCRRFAAHALKAGGCLKLFTDARALAASLKAANDEDEDGDDDESKAADAVEEDKREVAALVAAAETRANSKKGSGGVGKSASGGIGGSRGESGGSGGWAVVEDEVGEDHEGSGVGGILEAEAEERALAEKATSDEDAATAAAAASEAEAARVLASAARAQSESAAALGWAQVTSYGQTYWFHQAKNQTSRELPAEVAEHQAKQEGAGSGAAAAETAETATTTTATGWQALKDEQGRTYYFHPTTRQTSWFPR